MDNFGPAIGFMGNMVALGMTYKVASDVTRGITRSAGRSRSRRGSIWNY